LGRHNCKNGQQTLKGIKMEKGNPVGWFEIYVDDIEKAKRFYQDVFHVELSKLSPPGADESGWRCGNFRRILKTMAQAVRYAK
jgi:hypothetical protein